MNIVFDKKAKPYVQASQKGQIGVTLSCKWSVPFSKNTAGQKAAQRFIDFMLGW